MTTVPDVIPVLAPADGHVIEDVPIDSPERVAEAAAALRAAQPEWEAMGFAARARWMTEMRDWLLDNTDQIVDILQSEAGKVRAETVFEVGVLCDIINYYTKVGGKLLGDERVRPHLPLLRAKRFQVVRRPYPLIGVIGPWNFPLLLSVGDAIAGLLAGASALIKPSEVTPLAVREVVRGWRDEVGAPAIVDVVFGVGETGAALIDEVDFVQFTGSVATGRLVATRAAENLIPCCLELGGKDPAIVTKDADLDRAVNAVTWGGFVNSGQVCISLERAYVEEPIYEEFVRRVAANVKSLRQGHDGKRVEFDVGAMTAPKQTKIVEEHVEDARRKGARILTGGRRSDLGGEFYEPTVLADVDHSMTVMREETFGPVLPIMKVRDVEEAIRLANDSPFGLASSVFAGDVAEAERIARRLEAGTVNVNDALVAVTCIDAPMGGWKASGIGARNGAYGMLKYTRAKTICSPRLPTAKRELGWFPYTERNAGLFARLYRFFNARGLRARLGGKARNNG